MFKYRYSQFLALFLLFFTGMLYAADPLEGLRSGVRKAAGFFQQDDLLPADQAFHFIAEVKDGHTLRVSWQIADGYYLYRDRFKFSLSEASGVELKMPQLPSGKKKQEESGLADVYYHEVSFDLPLQRSLTGPLSVKLHARFQGCAERGVCYPPIEKLELLDLPADIVTATPVPEQTGAEASTASTVTASIPAQSVLMLPAAALLLIVGAIYFGALDRLSADASAGLRLKKGIMLALLIWGILMLIGVTAHSTDLLHPLRISH